MNTKNVSASFSLHLASFWSSMINLTRHGSMRIELGAPTTLSFQDQDEDHRVVWGVLLRLNFISRKVVILQIDQV